LTDAGMAEEFEELPGLEVEKLDPQDD
jgi:hypothetical protein